MFYEELLLWFYYNVCGRVQVNGRACLRSRPDLESRQLWSGAGCLSGELVGRRSGSCGLKNADVDIDSLNFVNNNVGYYCFWRRASSRHFAVQFGC